ncbi:MAG: hypothetical protein IJC56_12400 [Clostridia bacterium]|nr:hypothetical protein [Clostridia bacterium]
MFRNRGRIILSAIACVEMMFILGSGMFGLISWGSMPPTVEPVPAAAVAVTAHPDDDTINALSNIDDIIAMNMGAELNATLEPGATPILTQAEMLAQQEEVLSMTVYSVHRGAKYYHVSTVCGTQSNGRELTIRQAISENMGACPNCAPPVPYGAGRRVWEPPGLCPGPRQGLCPWTLPKG